MNNPAAHSGPAVHQKIHWSRSILRISFVFIPRTLATIVSGKKKTVTVVNVSAAFSCLSLFDSMIRKCHDSSSEVCRSISMKFCSVSSVEFKLKSMMLLSRPGWCVFDSIPPVTEFASPSLILSSKATNTRCWSSRVATIVSRSDLRSTKRSWYRRLRGLLRTSVVYKGSK